MKKNEKEFEASRVYQTPAAFVYKMELEGVIAASGDDDFLLEERDIEELTGAVLASGSKNIFNA